MMIETVAVIGSGVLGMQIALQTARFGHSVFAYDISPEQLEQAQHAMDRIGAQMCADLSISEQDMAAAKARISLTMDLSEAAQGADLIIEAIPERLDLKCDLYSKLNDLAPAHTIFASNSSTLMPSDMAESTGRPKQFLALHFANNIWLRNIAEIMGHAGTDPAIRDQVTAFAKGIGMEPIVLEKEQPGYVCNSLLVPLLQAGSALFVNGIAQPEDIDKVWRIATGAPMGPFQIYDTVGLNTAWHVASQGNETQKKFAEILKRDFIDQGKLGIATGEGFYKYK